jgi:long-chain-fatty-acid--CoA ligase ACSBG
MLSHQNILFIIETARQLVQFDETWRSVSYLPLSHVAATMLDIIGPAVVGFELHFASPDALQPGSRSLVQTLRIVRPDFFVGVPRVWERMAEQLQRAASQSPRPLRWLSSWAKEVMFHESQHWAYPQTEWRPGWMTQVADRMVLWPIRRLLGLDRARILISSAAPLDPETLDYFASLGMRISDLYGMSECTGPIAINLPWAYRRGTCGRAIPGTLVRVDAVSGELQVRGQHVFLGYLGDPASTAAAFTDDGFLRTGDLATMDTDGFITLTGRMKELLVTAGGENIAPLPLEKALERAMPAVARAMVIGDRRKFLSCLLSLHTAEDNETLVEEAVRVDPSITRASEASEAASVPGTPWHTYITHGLAAANQEAVSRAAQVRKAWIVPRAFSIQDQTLTPTLKLRRACIQAQYAEQIHRLYQT